MTAELRYLDEIQGVEMIAKTEPVKKLREMDIDDIEGFVTFVARVSNPTSQMKNMNNRKLLRYLINNAHWSPLAMANIVVEFKTARDISRQQLRHKSFDPQEFSQRYADPTDPDNKQGFCLREARLQDKTNRQKSIKLPADDWRHAEWERRQRDLLDKVAEHYKWAIDNDLAKEVARVLLPEGMTMTTTYFNGNIRSWIHYLALRTDNGTQLEHINLAKMTCDVIREAFPLIDELRNNPGKEAENEKKEA